MEILSDATFKGNVSINGGDFSITRSGGSDPVILTGPCGSTGKVDINGCVNFYSDVYVEKSAGISNLNVYCGARINGGAYIFGGTGTNIDGNFSVTRNGERSPYFVVGDTTIDNGSEFQSTIGGVFVNRDFYVDPLGNGTGLKIIECSHSATPYITFRGTEFLIESRLTVDKDAVICGNARISGAFSVTNDNSGRPNPLIEINKSYCGKNYSLYVDGTEWVKGRVIIDGNLEINGSSIANWSDLNNILCFAPSSLSSDVGCLSATVSSNTCKINTLCTTVANVPNFCSVTLDFDVPADCTKFIISTHSVMNSYYMFMTKGTNPMTPVNIDLEARCDSTTDSSWVFVATKSSGLAMNASDEYKLGYFYK